MSNTFDVIVIGSGLGGLVCAYILSKEGKKVCVLEKNQQFGGGLQTFKRDGVIFDTGVHYVGGLDEGQTLHTYFKFLNIIDKLKYKKLDENKFDVVSFQDSNTSYPYAQGKQNYIETLANYFPREKSNIKTYISELWKVGDRYPFYSLKSPSSEVKFTETDFTTSIYKFIDEHFSNHTLKQVLAGNNLLYSGNKEISTLYEHALISRSYIESSYRFVDGSTQVANALVRNIRANGGIVKRYKKVCNIKTKNKLACAVETEDGESFETDYVISNIHPKLTVDMIQEGNIRKSYKTRLNSINESASAYTIHLVLEEEKVPYYNYNIYNYLEEGDVWNSINYDEKNWPQSYMATTPLNSKSTKWADGMIAISYMNYNEVKKWGKIENVVGFEKERGQEYEAFKEEKSAIFIEQLKKKFPELKGNIKSHYASTPLTYRDYIATPNGAIYGYVKDYNSALKSLLSPQLRVKNVLLTGQNLNLHGVLGVTISALVSCGVLLGKEYLYQKVRKYL